MSGRQAVLTKAGRRVAAGFAVVAAAVLLAPIAAADPTSDADGAITAAYDASGGPTGPLGDRVGGVYPIGDGFGQDFASGKMFFTPPTGAHFTQGAILDKYESLGGPADSDLGFPTIDEGPGKVGPDSRNTTFSAPDRPVIFWTPDTGAQVVRGAVNAAWDRLGGSAGVLGVPTEDERYDSDVVSQKFTGGEVSWNRKTEQFTTVPPELAAQLADVSVPDDPTSAINAARRAAGGPLGPLGAPDGPQYPIGDDGVGQNFAGGKIFYSPQTGANVVTGQVLQKYESVGGPQGNLGLPTSNESDGGAPNSRMSSFAAGDQPVIFWTPDYGAVIVRGAMNAAWAKLGGATGPLGVPTADQSQNGDVVSQRFSSGVISWDRATGRFTTEPPALASQLAGLKVPGQSAPPKTSSTPQAAGDEQHRLFDWSWNWWWLVAVIPVLVLAGLLLAGAMWNRRRREAHNQLSVLDQAARYESVPVSGGYAEHTGHDGGDRYEPESSPYGVGAAPAPTAWDQEHERDDASAPQQAEPKAAHQDAAAAPSDLDEADTAPTRIEVDDTPLGVYVDDTPSGRHAKIDVEEPTPGRTALHLPLADPSEAPDGYPIKADTKSGLYWPPGHRRYADAVAEVWFSSEEFARTNGFVRADGAVHED
jgi:uncharacterized protein with LGFP repeats